MARLLCAVLLGATSYTAFMGAFAWEALRLTNRAGGPGMALAFASACALLAGPALGVAIDRYGPDFSYRAAQLTIATLLCLYASARGVGLGEGTTALIAWGALVSCVGAVTNPAMYGVVQSYSKPGSATVMASRTGVAVALGFVLGYAGGGQLLDAYGVITTLLFGAAAGVAAALTMPSVSPEAAKPRAGKPTPSAGAFIAGVSHLFSDPALRGAVLAYVLCYSVFHSVTALLPSFSKYVLESDASQFGILRGSWSVGSALGSLGLSLLWGSRRTAPASRFVPVLVLGVLLLLFSQTDSYRTAILMIALVGISHSICRGVLDGTVNEVCSPSMIGRVRSNVNGLLNAVSLVAYAGSSFVQEASVDDALAWIGATVALATGMQLLILARVAASARS